MHSVINVNLNSNFNKLASMYKKQTSKKLTKSFQVFSFVQFILSEAEIYSQMVLSLKGFLTEVTDILPLITVSEPVFSQGTGVIERLVACCTHQRV